MKVPFFIIFGTIAYLLSLQFFLGDGGTGIRTDPPEGQRPWGRFTFHAALSSVFVSKKDVSERLIGENPVDFEIHSP
jgi:hypothetical protein